MGRGATQKWPRARLALFYTGPALWLPPNMGETEGVRQRAVHPAITARVWQSTMGVVVIKDQPFQVSKKAARDSLRADGPTLRVSTFRRDGRLTGK